MQDDAQIEALAAALDAAPDLTNRGNAAAGECSVATAQSDEEELAAALAAVLSRKPSRSPPRPAPARDEARDHDDSDNGETAIVAPAARRAFVSALRNQASPQPAPVDFPEPDDGDPDDAAAAHTASSWLEASRRKTLRQKLNAAGAWVATVTIGTAIVVIAAVVLFEGPRDLEAWLDLAYRTL